METLNYQFKTLSEFKTAYMAQGEGHHFFDRDTMRFFHSRIESGLLKGKYFITSESDMRNTTRFFNVQMIEDNFRINTVAPFNTLTTKERAKDYIKRLTEEL